MQVRRTGSSGREDCDPRAQRDLAIPAAPPASPTLQSGTAVSYCALLIQVNTQLGTMVNKRLIPSTEWTQDQRTAIVKEALGHRDEFLAATPAELRPDIQVELEWYDNIAAAGLQVIAEAITAHASG